MVHAFVNVTYFLVKVVEFITQACMIVMWSFGQLYIHVDFLIKYDNDKHAKWHKMTLKGANSKKEL